MYINLFVGIPAEIWGELWDSGRLGVGVSGALEGGLVQVGAWALGGAEVSGRWWLLMLSLAARKRYSSFISQLTSIWTWWVHPGKIMAFFFFCKLIWSLFSPVIMKTALHNWVESIFNKLITCRIRSCQVPVISLWCLSLIMPHFPDEKK